MADGEDYFARRLLVKNFCMTPAELVALVFVVIHASVTNENF
jgi:hypothetical protein